VYDGVRPQQHSRAGACVWLVSALCDRGASGLRRLARRVRCACILAAGVRGIVSVQFSTQPPSPLCSLHYLSKYLTTHATSVLVSVRLLRVVTLRSAGDLSLIRMLLAVHSTMISALAGVWEQRQCFVNHCNDIRAEQKSQFYRFTFKLLTDTAEQENRVHAWWNSVARHSLTPALTDVQWGVLVKGWLHCVSLDQIFFFHERCQLNDEQCRTAVDSNQIRASFHCCSSHCRTYNFIVVLFRSAVKRHNSTQFLLTKG